MIAKTAEKLWEEIQAAEQERDQYLGDLEEQLDAYAGDAYSHEMTGTGGNIFNLENFDFSYVSLVLPRLVSGDPKIRITTALGEEQRQVVVGLKHSFNRWSRMARTRSTLSVAGAFYLFRCCILLTVFEPRGAEGRSRGDDLVAWPNWYVVHPRQFFMDHRADHWETARFFGHWKDIDHEDLQRLAAESDDDQGWDKAAIDAIEPTTGGNLHTKRGKKDAGPSREQVQVYEVWVPEHTIEGEDQGDDGPGFHGVIYTLVRSGDDEGPTFIRKPRPYWGPRTGPYTVMGVYPVPGRPWPLAPLHAARGQIDELKRHTEAMSNASRSYKRLVFVSADNPTLVEKVSGTPHDFVVPVRGFQRDQVVEVEIGGVTDQLIRHYADARERAERVLGMTEAQQGRPDRGVSATADAIAAESSGVRSGFIVGGFRYGVSQAIRNCLWYMAHDERFIMRLGSEAGEDLGQPGATLEYQGGDADSETSIEDLVDEIEIEPGSLDMFGDQQARMEIVDGIRIATEMAPIALQNPHMDWSEIFRTLGEALNMPSLVDIYDEQIAAALTQQMFQSDRADTPSEAQGLLSAIGRVQQPQQIQPARQSGAGRRAPNRLGGLGSARVPTSTGRPTTE